MRITHETRVGHGADVPRKPPSGFADLLAKSMAITGDDVSLLLLRVVEGDPAVYARVVGGVPDEEFLVARLQGDEVEISGEYPLSLRIQEPGHIDQVLEPDVTVGHPYDAVLDVIARQDVDELEDPEGSDEMEAE